MRTLEYYLSLPYRIEIIPDVEEGGYTARYPDLPGCITCADTLEILMRNAEDAKKNWLEAALEDGVDIAEPSAATDLSDYSGQFKLRLPRSLHRQLALQSKREGVSMNQYCVFLLSQNNAARA